MGVDLHRPQPRKAHRMRRCLWHVRVNHYPYAKPASRYRDALLAHYICQRLELPVLHLDTLCWRPGWQEPDAAGFHARTEAAPARGTLDHRGNYRQTFDLRLPHAELVIIIQPPHWRRLARVLRRVVTRGHDADLPERCPEHWDWSLATFIWHFARKAWPRVEVARIAHGPDVPVVRLRTDRDVHRFLALIPGN